MQSLYIVGKRKGQMTHYKMKVENYLQYQM